MPISLIYTDSPAAFEADTFVPIFVSDLDEGIYLENLRAEIELFGQMESPVLRG